MNAHTYNAPTISAGTIARTACLLLALTNQVLSALLGIRKTVFEK